MRPEGIHASQLVQGIEEPGFHRADGAAEGSGNSRQRIPRIETQMNDLLMLGREGLNASVH